MGSGKGNKHAGKRSYMKNYKKTKWWKLAQEARAEIHRPKSKGKKASDPA